LTDGSGCVPLAVSVTGANRHDITELLHLFDSVPPVKGRPGHPRKRPAIGQGDRGYDSQPHREALRRRGIRPLLARRRTAHGSGLGVFRWVVERAISWLHQPRRLKFRYEKRADIHEAFLEITCIRTCYRRLQRKTC
jgi:transposase